MHAHHDSLISFFTEEAANAFSANLKSGLRLLFAERYTHMLGRWGKKLGRSQQPLEMFHFGMSEWVNITAAAAWRARRKYLLSLLCLGLLAGAHSQWLPEIGPV